ncbi:ABC transporter ATP-binding protein [Bifidobacterium scardovii]|uniref:ABC-type multidrug transport system, ATPase and permease component n=1 Tax=Bifidobacterium scardovii TaxID=158787 RepID=A0A087DDL1_9BIFI|nr:ABC transporter ATP-binding protein [Bifidobacterium scardovii]KFI93611.1 ABC-type multidrug transport system, ATPase and permease component [Bifidobacterium scardovii]MDK6348623.1 ABC transporter ATP-binding protein [Bifidobacterium scardovii]MDU8982349.1 ABC transporter ATP-binding protein [Bifidobacterium scardovii]
MLRIMKYLSKAEIGQMLIALVTIIGQVYFDLKLPDYMSDITTLVETPGSDMKDIWIAGGKMLLISLGSVACAIITGYIAARVAASFTQRLRSLEFRKVESFGPAEMSQFSTASLITRSTNDITQVQMFITMGLQLIVKSPIMAVWAVCKIAGEGFEWTVATGIAVVILLVAIVIMMAMVMPKFKAMQALTDNINLVARENLTGLRVVRAYNAEDYQESKFTKANKELTETQLFTNRVMAFMMPLMNTIMNGLMLAVYWIGAYLIDAAGLKDKLTVFSNMVVFSNYSVQVIMSFLLMSMVFVLWPRADVSAQRIMEVLDTEPIVRNGTKTAADVAKTGQRGTVEFRNVSFTYPDSREAMLEGISFTAKQGQTVAFIGSTGSGKSSLINLVPRFYDVSQGQVLVDGVDVRDYDLKSLRDKIGYVPQQSVLFKGTVASNVSYGDQPGESSDVEMADTSTPAGRKREAELIAAGRAAEGADMPAEQLDRIKAAAGVAQASEFVERMDGEYSAAIAQGGSNVSGGQKQRLSIARAVYRHPEILIFDDSFSALDFKTDREVRDALAREAKDSTKLIVAQRIGTIMNADRIVVLDDGKVVGQGTHKELLEDCDVYRQIAESQLSQSELTA